MPRGPVTIACVRASRALSSSPLSAAIFALFLCKPAPDALETGGEVGRRGVSEHRDGMVSASPADTHSPARAKKKKRERKKEKEMEIARTHTWTQK